MKPLWLTCQAEKCRKLTHKQELVNLKNLMKRAIVSKKEMNEKGTQVAIGLKRIKKTSTGTQEMPKNATKRLSVDYHKAIMDGK